MIEEKAVFEEDSESGCSSARGTLIICEDELRRWVVAELLTVKETGKKMS